MRAETPTGTAHAVAGTAHAVKAERTKIVPQVQLVGSPILSFKYPLALGGHQYDQATKSGGQFGLPLRLAHSTTAPATCGLLCYRAVVIFLHALIGLRFRLMYS